MTEPFGYGNKRVIVSGCYSGIGRATAKVLLDLGAQVHGVDLQANDLDLRSFTSLDLREPGSVDAAVMSIGGRVDALFNCAGIPPGRPPLEVMKVNFIGTRHLTEQVLSLMTTGGAIANVASNGGAATYVNGVILRRLYWCTDHPAIAAEFGITMPLLHSLAQDKKIQLRLLVGPARARLLLGMRARRTRKYSEIFP